LIPAVAKMTVPEFSILDAIFDLFYGLHVDRIYCLSMTIFLILIFLQKRYCNPLFIIVYF